MPLRFHTTTPVAIQSGGNTSDGMLVFGGIAGVCSGRTPDVPADFDTVSASTWLYVPAGDTWLPVRSVRKPAARYKHVCAASAAIDAAMVCFGGISSAGVALADVWMLKIDSVEPQHGEATGTWTLLRTGLHSPAARHSTSLLPLPHSIGGATRGAAFVLLGGSRSSDRDATASSARGDVWLLRVPPEGCTAAAAAWAQLYPGGGPADVLLGAAAAPFDNGDVAVYGGYNIAAPVQAAAAFGTVPAMAAPLRILHGGDCLAAFELPPSGCSAPPTLPDACVPGAMRSSLRVDVDMSSMLSVLRAGKRQEVLDRIDIAVFDAYGGTVASRLHSAPAAGGSTAAPVSRRALSRRRLTQASITNSSWVSVDVPDVYYTADDATPDVVVLLHGLELARRRAVLLPGNSTVQLQVFPPTPYTVGAGAGVTVAPALAVEFDGAAVPWAAWVPPMAPVAANATTWPVRVTTNTLVCMPMFRGAERALHAGLAACCGDGSAGCV